MLKLLKPASPEDLFVERYDLLLGWALILTNHNQSQAEDLVHDAFIQFTHRRGDLAPIENADAYLHRMLRNMYLSEVRRAGMIQDSRFSIADFDSAEMGLRTFRANDPSEHLDLQDQLRQICQYACTRKQTSKAGSVLILRFFHGYYPSEIAQVLRTSRMAVDRWLQISRREAKAYLNDPASLKFMSDGRAPSPSVSGYARPTTELLSELRDTIFGSRANDCLSPAQLKERYLGKTTIEGGLLSHLVSCPSCLDTVNRLLALPLLTERSSEERLGRDVPPDKSGGSGTGGSGISIMESKKKYQRREKEVMEHRPQELRIAVNGFVVGSQQVSSELSKLALTVNVDEPIGFIEVFSEQAVRLLFFDVDQPTDGRIEQSTGVDFDCGRSLDLSLNFRGAWPSLNVAYHDPTFEAVESYVEEEVQSRKSNVQGRGSSPTPGSPDGQPDWGGAVREGSVPGLLARARAGLASLVRKRKDLRLPTWEFGLLLRPATITALFALVLLLTVVLIYRRTPPNPLLAADLLHRAVVSEDAIAANRDQVVHRTLQLEEKSSSGQLLSTRRIDIWQSAEKGITARRLYDERGALIAGDWRRADGVQTLYHHGRRPELRTTAERTSAPVNFDSVWLLDPTAKEFVSLIGGSQNAKALETANTYVVSYGNVNANSPGLISASLVLGRADLHAIEQALMIRQGNEVREYKFTETSFERRRSDSVAPAVFEPDSELIGDAETRGHGDTESLTASPGLPIPASGSLATAALEVEVIEALNNANAFTGEPIEVSRSANGKITVTGMVETDQRKRALLAALATFKNNPAVQVKIETVAEAQARAKSEARKPGQTSVGEVQKFEVTEGQNPAYTELRKRFSEAEARRFADSVLSRIQSARSHARAMKQISQRFSQSDLQSLTPGERGRWLALIRSHAERFVRETESVRHDLQQFFSEASAGSSGSGAISGDAQLQAAIRELFDASGTIERGLNQSFALTAGANNASTVKSPAFWRQFADAVRVARSIAAAK